MKEKDISYASLSRTTGIDESKLKRIFSSRQSMTLEDRIAGADKGIKIGNFAKSVGLGGEVGDNQGGHFWERSPGNPGAEGTPGIPGNPGLAGERGRDGSFTFRVVDELP